MMGASSCFMHALAVCYSHPIMLNGFLFICALSSDSSRVLELASIGMCLFLGEWDRSSGIARHQGSDNIGSSRCLELMEWYSSFLHVARSCMQHPPSKGRDLGPIITEVGRFIVPLHREPLLPKKHPLCRQLLPRRDSSRNQLLVPPTISESQEQFLPRWNPNKSYKLITP